MQSLIYFDDLIEGQQYWGSECAADKAEMLDYAQKNDPWPFHIDEEAAKASIFGGLIASGGYTITLVYRSLTHVYNTVDRAWAFQGGVEWPSVKFLLPVKPGDRLQARMTIRGMRISSKPGRGIVTALTEALNQDGAVVYSNEVVFFMATRPKGG
jgi:acyl dehydratase